MKNTEIEEEIEERETTIENLSNEINDLEITSKDNERILEKFHQFLT